MATNTHLGCVILIAFPLQQWSHERVSILRYTYIGCLAKNILKECYTIVVGRTEKKSRLIRKKKFSFFKVRPLPEFLHKVRILNLVCLVTLRTLVLAKGQGN